MARAKSPSGEADRPINERPLLLTLLLLVAMIVAVLLPALVWELVRPVKRWGAARIFSVRQERAAGRPVPAPGLQGEEYGRWPGPVDTHRQTVRLGEWGLEFFWYSR